MERKRKSGSQSLASLTIAACSTVLFLLNLEVLQICSAAVFTVDYGSESVKVAVVNPRPGQSPISIAINEMSKRKSPALVAYSAGDRLVSEEAAGILARYPDRVYSLLRNVIGLPIDEVKRVLTSNYLPFDVVEDSSRPGSAKIRSHDGEIEFFPEELVGMLFAYARELAEAHTQASVPDAAISVPAHFSQAQRQAILDAAALGGVNVMALYQEHAGVALQYGIDKDFDNETRNVLIYDMGASSTSAVVLQFSSYSAKDRGKTTNFNQFQLKSIQWDHDLGGLSFEKRLVEHFANEFNARMGKGFDIRKFPKGMAKLKKQVKRTKEILSANAEAPISVESLFEETDFRSSISREKFEELCSDLWLRALNPLKLALEESSLSLADVYGVELVGGATRIPKLQSVLSDFLGNKSLDRHLDADEAMALGASLFAANMSDGFKLNRRLGMVDGLPFSVLYKVNAVLVSAGGVSGGEIVKGELVDEQILFPRLKKFPIKIIRSLRDIISDFLVSFFYDESDSAVLPPGWPKKTPIAEVLVTGLANATARYSAYNLTQPLKTNLHFLLSRSGLVSLEKAELVVEFSEWIEVPVTVNVTASSNETIGSTNSTNNSSSNNSSDNSAGGDEAEGSVEVESKGSEKGGDGEGNVEGAGGKGNVTEGEVVKEEQKVVMKKKLRKRTIRPGLKAEDVTSGFQRGLRKEEMKQAEQRLEILKKRDEEKKATAEAKNNLEAYIYSMKDKMESVEGIVAVTTEAQREEFKSQLNEAEDWLYMDGENANATEFKEKLSDLKITGDSIFFRLEETTARPEAVASARSFAQSTLERLDSFEVEKPWVNKSEIAPVVKEVEALKAWLDDKEEKQKLVPKHENPVLTSDQIKSKVERIQEKVNRINRIPKPRPKKPTIKATANDEAGEGFNATSTETNSTESRESTSSTTSEPKASGEGKQEDRKIEEEVRDKGHDEL